MAYTGIVTTFRIPGAAATTQNLFTLENTTGSAVVVTIRRLMLQMDATAVLTAVMPQFKTSRCAVPSGGTTITKGTFDSTQTSAANVVARGGASADGTASAITATPGTAIWQQFGMRMHTVVGQVLAVDCDMLPVLIADTNLPSFKLAANEAIVVHIIAAAGTSNPATNHYVVNCVWTEA